MLPITINGRRFQADLASEAFSFKSVPLIRQQGDSSAQTGEATINPHNPWQRSISSWHEGGGQTYFDKPESSAYRFSKSRRVNPWHRDELRMLESVFTMDGTFGNNFAAGHSPVCRFIQVGAYSYLLRSELFPTTGALSFATDPAFGAFTTVATYVTPVSSLCDDGYNIWVAVGVNGVDTTTRGAGASSNYVSSAVADDAAVAFVNGRLMLGTGNVLYNITAAGVLPTTLAGGKMLTHSSMDFKWEFFAEGPEYIYAGGNAGSVGLIYQVGIQPDGTALAVPTQCAKLPEGESLTGLFGYQGFIVIGTNKGFRLAQVNGDGSLRYGALVDPHTFIRNESTDNPYVNNFNQLSMGVRSFHAEESFIWFGVDIIQSDAASQTQTVGLCRMDLSTFTGDLVPAVAVDAEVSVAVGYETYLKYGSGSIIRTYADGDLFFTQELVGSGGYVDRRQVFRQQPPQFTNAPDGTGTGSVVYYSEGVVESGKLTYGLSSMKIPTSLETVLDNEFGETAAAFDTPVTATVYSDGNSTELAAVVRPGGFQNVIVDAGREQSLSLSLSPYSVNISPVLSRVTLYAEPIPRRSALLVLPLLITDGIQDKDHIERRDVRDDFSFLMDLVMTPTTTITVGVADDIYTATIMEDFTFVPHDLLLDDSAYQGTFVLTCKVNPVGS